MGPQRRVKSLGVQETLMNIHDKGESASDLTSGPKSSSCSEVATAKYDLHSRPIGPL